MRVAIVGAGPAGSHLAYQLSKSGMEVLLFDARPAWEKPCGGGVTSKALREFEFLRDGPAPKQMVSSLRLISAQGRELTVAPRHDFAIYSRQELATMMRQRAVEAGAQLHVARVEKTERESGQWRLANSLWTFWWVRTAPAASFAAGSACSLDRMISPTPWAGTYAMRNRQHAWT